MLSTGEEGRTVPERSLQLLRRAMPCALGCPELGLSLHPSGCPHPSRLCRVLGGVWGSPRAPELCGWGTASVEQGVTNAWCRAGRRGLRE